MLLHIVRLLVGERGRGRGALVVASFDYISRNTCAVKSIKTTRENHIQITNAHTHTHTSISSTEIHEHHVKAFSCTQPNFGK